MPNAVKSTPPRLLPVSLDQFTISDKEFRQLREFIYLHTGIALSDHKRALVCSRLGKRLRHIGLQKYQDYYHLLVEQDPNGDELTHMINAITTNKTDFLREPHHFDYLCKTLFPEWRKQLTAHGRRRLRIWSAGTATGEEAYSIAMTVLDAFPDIAQWDIKILATDIDTNVLARAERGIYSLSQVQRIPEPQLRRYFLKGVKGCSGYVRVKPALQNLIRFRHLNLMQNPWPMHGPFDVIFCRNVIIYFDKTTQRSLLNRMETLMHPGAHLMLGHSEALHGITSRFDFVSHSIYRLARGR